MWQLLPFVSKQETDRIMVAIIDGTTHVSEALVIVVRYLTLTDNKFVGSSLSHCAEMK